MLNINNKKTKEILNEIDENVNVEDLGLLLRQSGLLVKVHVGRARGAKKVNLKALGINDKEVLEFMKEYFKNGEFNYIGIRKNQDFAKVESNLRKELASRAIGYDGQFLTIEDYKEFKKIFEKEKVRYLEMRDNVYNDWDNIIGEFKTNLKDALFKLGCQDPNIYQSILDSIPSQDKYRDSFYVSISLKAFPVLENANFFDPEIADLLEDTQQNELASCVNEVTGNVLGLAFKTLDNTLNKCSETGKVEYRTRNTLMTTSKKLTRRNIAGNQFIFNVAMEFDKCHSLLENKEYDDFLDVGEDVLIKIYGHLKELHLLEYINFKNTMYSEEELDLLYDIYKKNNNLNTHSLENEISQ